MSVKSNRSQPLCKSWAHDTSEWKRTIIHEWDLVCDREPLLKLTQQVTFFGLLCGVFISGLLSDRYIFCMISNQIFNLECLCKSK